MEDQTRCSTVESVFATTATAVHCILIFKAEEAGGPGTFCKVVVVSGTYLQCKERLLELRTRCDTIYVSQLYFNLFLASQDALEVM